MAEADISSSICYCAPCSSHIDATTELVTLVDFFNQPRVTTTGLHAPKSIELLTMEDFKSTGTHPF